LTGSVSVDGQTTITGQLKFPNGSAAAPSHTFASNLTTGMYYIGTKYLGFTTGGTQIVAFNGNSQGSGQSGNVIEINTATGTIYPNPVGFIGDFAGPTAPAGWLLCYGQVVNTSDYPELFVALGSTNTYGGNGTTTFGIPDCRGRASFGKDNMGGSAANRITSAGGNFDGTVLGGTGGQQNFTLTTTQLPAIKPAITITDPGHLHITSNLVVNGGGSDNILTSGGIINITAPNTNTAVTGITAAFTSNLGSGNATPVLSPSIIFNKIIFAGRV
jgi:microcystin-dependent protein